MSKFEEYLEQTGSIKKEVINESYKVIQADITTDLINGYLCHDNKTELKTSELEDIARIIKFNES